eukprot:TRINITY_DN507_c0_g1_i1.p1 TRINITY_DN507_c0_g1~~TRINITY_DN507_c0_g1_i1.p1  ORF type:complete len:126 (-),score=15.18 TRINITY_DN507_c0_g1_i1:449-826(-)
MKRTTRNRKKLSLTVVLAVAFLIFLALFALVLFQFDVQSAPLIQKPTAATTSFSRNESKLEITQIEGTKVTGVKSVLETESLKKNFKLQKKEGFYDLEAIDNLKNKIDFSSYEGKVVLVVNVASR